VEKWRELSRTTVAVSPFRTIRAHPGPPSKKSNIFRTFSALIGDGHRGRIGGGPEVAAAIGTELVRGAYPTLALRTNGAQPALASWAEAESGLDDSGALRTVQGARLPQNEIEDDAECVGDEGSQQRPKNRAHAAAAGVFVNVADEQDGASEDSSSKDYQRDEYRQPEKRISTLVRVKREQHGHQRYDIAESGDRPNPRRNDADLVREAR